MKKCIVYCVAALMLASLVMTNALLAPATRNAGAQERGKPKAPDQSPPKKGERDLITKEKFCNDCKKKYREECNTPGYRNLCNVNYNICKDGCRYVGPERRQSCLEGCEVKRQECPEQCVKNKCKEECEGVDDDPPEDD